MIKRILLAIALLLLSQSAWATNWSQHANAVFVYTLDVDENPVDDVSSNSNTGALKGDGEPNYSTVNPPDSGDGFSGTSVGYYIWDKTDDYIQVANLTGYYDQITYVNWIYPISYGEATAGGRMFDKRSSATQSLLFSISSDGVGGIWGSFVRTFSISQGQWIFPAGSIPSSEWIHLAVSYDETSTSNNPIIYKDGVPLSLTENPSPDGNLVDTTDPYIIGNRTNDTDRTFDGGIDEIALFSTILDSTDINDIMDNGLVQAAPSRRPIIISENDHEQDYRLVKNERRLQSDN